MALLLVFTAAGASGSVLIHARASSARRRSYAAAAHPGSFIMGFALQTDITLPLNWLGVLMMIAFGICLEAVHLRAVEAAKQKADLRLGFTRHIRDA